MSKERRLFIGTLLLLSFFLITGFYHQANEVVSGQCQSGNFSFNGKLNLIGINDRNDYFTLNINDNNNIPLVKVSNYGMLMMKDNYLMRENPGGWFAIQPPELQLNGGFASLLFSSDVTFNGAEGKNIARFQDVAGNDKFFIDQSGNVGISASYRNLTHTLDIAGTFRVDTPDTPLNNSEIAIVTSKFGASGYIPVMKVTQDRGTYIVDGHDGFNSPGLYLYGGNTDGRSGVGAFVGGDMENHFTVGPLSAETVNATLIEFDAQGRIVFHADFNITKDANYTPTPRMIIDGNTGNVGIGTSNPTALFEVACPTGFINVKAGNNQLGCIQTDEQGTDVWNGASDDCFINYGGRLPTSGELYLSMLNFILTAETDDWEWTEDTGDISNSYVMAASGNITMTDLSDGSIARAYRCMIPR